MLLETDPPLHERTRSVVNRVVGRAALLALRPAWEARAETLVESLVARGTFDGVRDLAELYPLAVFPNTVGMPETGRANLLPYGAMVFNAFGLRNRLTIESMAGAQEAMKWVTRSCKRPALSPGGFGTGIFAAVDRSELVEDEAERLVRSFLTAGVDTTVNGLGNMLHAFATHPDQRWALREDPSLLPLAFDEVLRLDCPCRLFVRTTTRAVEIEGTLIHEGAKVLLFLAAANRDPRKWLLPDKFDLRRRAVGQVAFGAVSRERRKTVYLCGVPA